MGDLSVRYMAVCLILQMLVVEFMYRLFGVMIVSEKNLYICLAIAQAFFNRYLCLYILRKDTKGWLTYAGCMFMLYFVDVYILHTEYIDLTEIHMLGLAGIIAYVLLYIIMVVIDFLPNGWYN